MLYVYVYGLAFLELTFILVAFMLLHSLRQAIGSGPFYLAQGGVLVFAQLVATMGLGISGAAEGLHISVGSTIFYTPFMAALLIVYIVDGTVEAQRFIWGLMGMVGIFVYLAHLTEKQVALSLPLGWLSGETSYVVFPQFQPEWLQGLLSSSRIFMLASLLTILVEFLSLPVIYEILRGWQCRLSICIFGALIFAQVLDAFFFELVMRPGAADWWDGLRLSFWARAGTMVWVALLTLVYLRLRHASAATSQTRRRPQDILLAILGGYGQAQRLQANLREWEGRYRMVVESTNDFILLVDESGTVLDANRMLRQRTGYTIEELLHLDIAGLLFLNPETPCRWRDTWHKLRDDSSADANAGAHAPPHEWMLRTRSGEFLEVETTITRLYLQRTFGALLVARDITNRKRLQREREQLQQHFLHAQRMEAVGRLAGGIAHDFNNLLHAIRGSLDTLEARLPHDDRSRQILDTIGTATDRAGRLTDHLLGFARGGKYEVGPISVGEFLQETQALFEPLLGRKATLKLAVHPDPMLIAGDETQLQQVLLNLLINARDALPETGGRIVVRAEPATTHTPGWPSPKALGPPDTWIVIRVKDNGTGMTDEVLKHIFEPFFTTKASRGTGMGLAMVYGCVENHHGWIHVQSQPGIGSEFIVFLPRHP